MLDVGSGTGCVLVASRFRSRSATALLADATDKLAAYFDHRPRLTGGFMDQPDREIQAVFEARFGGAAVRGIAIVKIVNGEGSVGIIYDRAEKLAASVGRLMGAFGRTQPQQPLTRQVSWQQVSLPDGSGSMRLPTGWQITGAYQGIVDAQGPEGMLVSLGAAYQVVTPQGAQGPFGPMRFPFVAPYTDPARALQALLPQLIQFQQSIGQPMPAMRLVRFIEQTPVPDLLPGGQAAFLHYELDVQTGSQAQRYQCLSLIGTAPISYDRWMYYNSTVAAPADSFKRNLPLLLEIWGSWKVSDHTLRQRLQNAVQSMQEAGEIYRQSHQNTQRAFDNANADWSEVIRGYRAVEDTSTGERGEAALDWADKIVEKMNEREGWDRYRAIPLRDLDRE